MEDKLLQFKNYLVRNGRTESTAKAYVFQVKKLLNACKEITQEKVDEYLTEHAKRSEGSYMNLTINALKAYFVYVEQNILMPKWAKVTHKKIQSLPMEFVENKILPAVDYLNFQNPYKVKAVLYLMAYTGMRKCEVPILTRENIDLNNRRIKVYLKKVKKERIFKIPKKVADEIQEYFKTEDEQINAFNIGQSGVNNIFLKLKKYFKDDVNLFPHLLKKTAITHLHNVCGFSLKEVSIMVGISVQTIETHYLDIDMDKIEEDYDERIK